MIKRHIRLAACAGIACIAPFLLVHKSPAAFSHTPDGRESPNPAETTTARRVSPQTIHMLGPVYQPACELRLLLQELQEMESSQRQAKLEDPAFQAQLADAARIQLQKALEKNEGAAIGHFQNLMSHWVQLDLPGARGWIAGQAPGVLVDRLVEQVAMALAMQDPTEAAFFVVENIPSGPIQNEAVISVLHHLIQQDLDTALAWVEVFPPGDLRDQAYRELSEIDVYPANEPPGR